MPFMGRTKAFNETEILEKAVSLFWKQGYLATSPDEIVNDLGISRSSMYNTFGDKRKLFIKSLKRYIDTKTKKMIANLDASDNARECLTAVFNSMIDCNGDNNQYGCFVINTTVELSDADAEIRDILDRNHRKILQALGGLIERSRQNETLSSLVNSKKLAQFIYNSIIGIRVNVRAKTSKTELKNIAEMTLSVLT